MAQSSLSLISGVAEAPPRSPSFNVCAATWRWWRESCWRRSDCAQEGAASGAASEAGPFELAPPLSADQAASRPRSAASPNPSADDAFWRAAPAAACRCFRQHGETDLVGGIGECFLVLCFAMIAGHQRHPGLFHQRLGAGLRPHRFHHLGGRTDEHNPFGGTAACELGILRQEAVTRMDRVRARNLGGRNDVGNVGKSQLGNSQSEITLERSPSEQSQLDKSQLEIRNKFGGQS